MFYFLFISALKHSVVGHVTILTGIVNHFRSPGRVQMIWTDNKIRYQYFIFICIKAHIDESTK